MQICKNWQELPRSSSQLHPLRGGAGSKTPTGRVTGAPPFCMELSPCRNEVVHFISVCMHFCIIAYMHTSIYAYNANWGASTKNRSKTNRKSLRNRPQNGPKSVPNRSKIGFGTDLAANIDFGPSWNRFRTVLGPLLAASWRPLGDQVGVKLVQKSIFGGPGWRSKTNMMLDTFLNRFLIGLGAIWGSKIDPKSVQNQAQAQP